MLLVVVTLAWLALQLVLRRIGPRLTSSISLTLAPFSLHLSSTSFNAFPSAVLRRLPRLAKHGKSDGRRLGVLWDLGALAGVVGLVLAQGVLLWAAGTAMGAVVRLLLGDGRRGEVSQAARDPTQDLLLRPLIPSLSSVPLLVLASVVSQGFHEFGHALAAASKSIPLLSAGLHLYLFLPTFYVTLPASADPTSSALTDLRVASAGVWHNLLLIAAAGVLSDAGAGIGRTLALAVGFVTAAEEGVVVVDVEKHSPLASLLPRGSLVTHLDDYELDASTSPAGSATSAWSAYLRADSELASDPYANMGWCLPEELFEREADPECCARNGGGAAGAAREKPQLCFIDSSSTSSSSSSPSRRACLDPLSYLPPSPSLPPRCIDSSSCTSHPDTLCTRISPDEKVLRIGVHKPALEGRGQSETVVWQGEKEGVLRAVSVTDLLPRYFVPLGLDLAFERFFAAVTSISLSLAFFNLLPLPHLDGSHILSALLYSLTPPSLPTSRRPTSSVSIEDGLLAGVLGRLRRIGRLRRAAEEREKWERRAGRWTALVGGVGLAATVIVEVAVLL
ncbi:hypothetical protein JCM10213_000665 [Rhodosporidiobolus nylandii]